MAVSLLGTIQPDRLNRLVLSGDNDGLASRFLFAWPTPRPKKRPQTVPRRELLYDTVDRLSRIGFDIPLTIPVSATGVALFEQWREGLHQSDTDAAAGLLKEAYGKLEGLVLRLALIFEYVRWASSPDRTAEPMEISTACIESAIELADVWAKPTFRRVFAEAAVSAADRNAATLARLIARERPREINARALRRMRKADLPGIRESADMDAACEALVDAQWLRPKFSRAGDTKGRRPKTYDVNPRLNSCLPSVANSAISVNRRAIDTNGTNVGSPYTDIRRAV